jgi:hypothetical protein
MSGNGWIGVVFDGALAKYEKCEGELELGDPVWEMTERVKQWVEFGKDVRIVTGRVADQSGLKNVIDAIEGWCSEHLGKVLPVTCTIDSDMTELWGADLIQVVKNVGVPVHRGNRDGLRRKKS